VPSCEREGLARYPLSLPFPAHHPRSGESHLAADFGGRLEKRASASSLMRA